MDNGMTELNQLAHLQTEIAHAYMRQHKITPKEFVELDRKYGILRYLEIGYEPFHLTGTQGVVEEVEDYIRIQQAREQRESAPNPSAAARHLPS